MTEVTIIGGGIVGLATAHALLEHGIESVRVLEKEAALAQHQSTHNSGVLHAGLQYRPDSQKAVLARDGIRRMTEFCQHHGVAHEICGKLVVAGTEEELPRLEAMLDRGRQNGLKGLRLLSAEDAAEIEPHVRCVAAIHVPEEGIVDYGGVCKVLSQEIEGAGGSVVTGARVDSLRHEAFGWHIATSTGEYRSRVIVNCSGLHSDRIVKMAGGDPGCRIIPFRGEYHRLRSDREHLVRHLVYPLPEPGFPFLGVHFTRRIDGGIDAGPNAVLAFAREGYRLSTVNPLDLAGALSYPGLWRFMARHRRMVGRELAQSASRRRFVKALQRLIPEIKSEDLLAGGSGVRAQAMSRSGELVHDFVWADAPGAVHAINAPSPAATASLTIGRIIAERAVTQLG